MNYFVHFMMSSLPISEKSRQELVTETVKDDTLQKLWHQISADWLEHDLKLDPCLRSYHHHNSEAFSQEPTNHSALYTLIVNVQNLIPRLPGNWKNKITSQIITYLATHECWHIRYDIKLWGMPTIQKLSRCWTTKEWWNPWQALDKSWYRHVQNTRENLLDCCGLLLKVS